MQYQPEYSSFPNNKKEELEHETIRILRNINGRHPSWMWQLEGGSANSLPSLKFIAKQILESIKNQLDDLIDREQTDFWSGSSRIDHINTLKAILEPGQTRRIPKKLHYRLPESTVFFIQCICR